MSKTPLTPEEEADLPCARCGGPHQFDTSVPSPAWNRVIRDHGWPEFLCTTCIVLLFVRAGESFEAELYGDAVGLPTVPVIRVQVEDRPFGSTYGDLQARLATLDAARSTDAYRADLAAKVRALPTDCHTDDGWYHQQDNSECMAVDKTAVLALIEDEPQ